VNKILASFVQQPSAPVVTVDARCAGGDTDVSRAQHRFGVTAGAASRATASVPGTWAIPVCLRVPGTGDGAGVRCELLDDAREALTVDRCVPLVAANASGRGYYRTLYEPDDLLAIARRRSNRAKSFHSSPTRPRWYVPDVRPLTGAAVARPAKIRLE
jgi:aminopeptidase N